MKQPKELRFKSNKSYGWLLHIPISGDRLKGRASDKVRKVGYSSNSHRRESSSHSLTSQNGRETSHA